jgi:nitrilase
MKRELLKPGGGFAMIFGPDGAPLAEPLEEHTEGLVYADIDLGMRSIAKAAADPTGHYSRPDVTRLLLNSTPAPRVAPMSTWFDDVERGPEAGPAGDASANTDVADAEQDAPARPAGV